MNRETAKQTWREQEDARKAERAAFLATEPSAEELARIRQGELGAERRQDDYASYAVGGTVDGYSRTLARNVNPEDVDLLLRRLALGEGVKDLHAWPEAF